MHTWRMQISRRLGRSVGGFAFLGFQINRIDTKIDAIPQVLREEFQAMRAEMAAQTSAIANSITATRQSHPPAPIVVIPPNSPAPPASQQ